MPKQMGLRDELLTLFDFVTRKTDPKGIALGAPRPPDLDEIINRHLRHCATCRTSIEKEHA